MVRTGVYNEERDIQAVEQVGFIDLGEAIRNGYVPASIEADDMVYNGIEEPASIMKNADDVFALYRQQDYINSFGVNSEDTTPTE